MPAGANGSGRWNTGQPTGNPPDGAAPTLEQTIEWAIAHATENPWNAGKIKTHSAPA